MILFSCFPLPNSFFTFLALRRASGPDFMFCDAGLVFGGTEGVGSRFHVLRARTRFWRYRGHQFSFPYFVIPGLISAVRRASGLDFTFCARGLIFGGTEGVGSHFHVLRSQKFFRRCGGRRVPFSCFTLSDKFSVVPRASHVLRARIRCRQYRGIRLPFSCFARPNSFSAV
jgi:hypothetical protein